MQMLHEMSRDDMNSTFADTYLKASIKGKEEAVYVSEFCSDYVNVKSVPEGEWHEVGYDDINLYTSDLGMFVDGSHLYYLARRPERQWRRGTRAQVCTAYSLSNDGSSMRLDIRGDLGGSWFERAIDYFFNNRAPDSCIINRDWAFAGDVLFFRSVPIGTKDGSVVHIYEHLRDVQLPKLEGLTYV